MGDGDTRYPFVQQGNGLASRCCIFIWLACACECIWFLEQPGQSILLSYRRFDLLWKTVVAFQQRFWMGAFSGPTPKPHFVISNHWEFARGIVSWVLVKYLFIFSFSFVTCFGLTWCSFVLRKAVVATYPKSAGRNCSAGLWQSRMERATRALRKL